MYLTFLLFKCFCLQKQLRKYVKKTNLKDIATIAKT